MAQPETWGRAAVARSGDHEREDQAPAQPGRRTLSEQVPPGGAAAGRAQPTGASRAPRRGGHPLGVLFGGPTPGHGDAHDPARAPAAAVGPELAPQRDRAPAHDGSATQGGAPRGGSARAVANNGLPPDTLAFFEEMFGADFSNVEIHVSAEPARVGAVAFTRGNHIYISPGFYQPHTVEGLRLLGHELTHVLQQRAGRLSIRSEDKPLGDDALEAEAEAMGDRAAAGGKADVPTGATTEVRADQAQVQGIWWKIVRVVIGVIIDEGAEVARKHIESLLKEIVDEELRQILKEILRLKLLSEVVGGPFEKALELLIRKLLRRVAGLENGPLTGEEPIQEGGKIEERTEDRDGESSEEDQRGEELSVEEAEEVLREHPFLERLIDGVSRVSARQIVDLARVGLLRYLLTGPLAGLRGLSEKLGGSVVDFLSRHAGAIDKMLNVLRISKAKIPKKHTFEHLAKLREKLVRDIGKAEKIIEGAGTLGFRGSLITAVGAGLMEAIMALVTGEGSLGARLMQALRAGGRGLVMSLIQSAVHAAVATALPGVGWILGPLLGAIVAEGARLVFEWWMAQRKDKEGEGEENHGKKDQGEEHEDELRDDERDELHDDVQEEAPPPRLITSWRQRMGMGRGVGPSQWALAGFRQQVGLSPPTIDGMPLGMGFVAQPSGSPGALVRPGTQRRGMTGLGWFGLGMPGLGIPGLGVFGMGMPGMGMPGMGIPGMGSFGLGMPPQPQGMELVHPERPLSLPPWIAQGLEQLAEIGQPLEVRRTSSGGIVVLVLTREGVVVPVQVVLPRPEPRRSSAQIELLDDEQESGHGAHTDDRTDRSRGEPSGERPQIVEVSSTTENGLELPPRVSHEQRPIEPQPQEIVEPQEVVEQHQESGGKPSAKIEYQIELDTSGREHQVPVSKHDDEDDVPAQGGKKQPAEPDEFLRRILFRRGVPRRRPAKPQYVGSQQKLGGRTEGGPVPLHEQRGLDLHVGRRRDRLQPPSDEAPVIPPVPPQGYVGGSGALGGVVVPDHEQRRRERQERLNDEPSSSRVPSPGYVGGSGVLGGVHVPPLERERRERQERRQDAPSDEAPVPPQGFVGGSGVLGGIEVPEHERARRERQRQVPSSDVVPPQGYVGGSGALGGNFVPDRELERRKHLRSTDDRVLRGGSGLLGEGQVPTNDPLATARRRGGERVGTESEHRGAYEPTSAQYRAMLQRNVTLRWVAPDGLCIFGAVGALVNLPARTVLARVIEAAKTQASAVVEIAKEAGVEMAELIRCLEQNDWASEAGDIVLDVVLAVMNLGATVVFEDGRIQDFNGGGRLLVRVKHPLEHYHATNL